MQFHPQGVARCASRVGPSGTVERHRKPVDGRDDPIEQCVIGAIFRREQEEQSRSGPLRKVCFIIARNGSVPLPVYRGYLKPKRALVEWNDV